MAQETSESHLTFALPSHLQDADSLNNKQEISMSEALSRSPFLPFSIAFCFGHHYWYTLQQGDLDYVLAL